MRHHGTVSRTFSLSAFKMSPGPRYLALALVFCAALQAQGWNRELLHAHSVNIEPDNFSVSTSATVQWRAPADHSVYDRIYWYGVNVDGTVSLITSHSLDGPANSTAGNVTFSGASAIPAVQQYVARYIPYGGHDPQPLAYSNIGTATTDEYAVTTVSKTSEIHSPLTITWTAPSGHDSGDQLALYYILQDNSAQQVSAVKLNSPDTSGIVVFPGSSVSSLGYYFAAYVLRSGLTVAAESELVQISAIGYSVAFVDSSFTAGSIVDVSFTVPLGATSTRNDLIKIFFVQPDGTYLLKGSQIPELPARSSRFDTEADGTVSFSGSQISRIGVYVTEYVIGGLEGDVIAATSEPGKSTNVGYSVTFTTTQYSVYANATVGWEAADEYHSKNDVVSLYYQSPTGELVHESSQQVGTSATSGTVTFVGSSLRYPGSYIAKYILGGDGDVVASTDSVKLNFDGYIVTVPNDALPAMSDVTVVWSTPDTHHSTFDDINLYNVNSGTAVKVATHKVPSGSSGTITFPGLSVFGSYVVKYILTGGDVATSSDTFLVNVDDYSLQVTPDPLVVNGQALVFWTSPMHSMHNQDQVLLLVCYC